MKYKKWGAGAVPLGSMSPLSPSPEIPLPKWERDFNPAPLLPLWEKGLGDEGRFAEVTCSRAPA